MLKLSLSLSLSQAITSNGNPKALMLSFNLLKSLAKLRQYTVEKLATAYVANANLCLNCSSVYYKLFMDKCL